MRARCSSSSLPMVLLQSVLIASCSWSGTGILVTQRLSAAVSHDIAALIDVYETYPQDANAAFLRRSREERLGLTVDFLPDADLPPPGPKPFFSLLDQALSGEIGADRQRPFWIDTVGRSNADRNPHPARQRRDARLRAAQPRLCVELAHLPALDGRHLAGAARRRDPVPAQPDPADPAARRRRRSLRQGPRGAEFPPARRARGAARGGAPSSK